MLKKEILFFWDGENFNPNGDMLNDNAPRLDEETSLAEATDVRIKRTIRDELIRENPDQIFIKTYEDKDGKILDAKTAMREETKLNIDIKKANKDEIIEAILSNFIDIRAFGGVLPISDNKEKEVKTKSVSFTGPVQFRISKSLHKVSVKYIKGAGAFASGSDKDAKTFREESFLDYAFFATYGIFDNNNAKNTNFSEDDAKKILKALWNGSKNLTTRTKIGQIPRFLLIISYKNNTFTGDLNNLVSIISQKEDEAIRSIKDFKINFSNLKEKLELYKNDIEKIEFISDFNFKNLNEDEFDKSWVEIDVNSL
ncbi:type I-B CRISPR-associated protein Cas7/Csh2 [Campylobacter sp. RM12327]|uniref:type I-B CRISPR-associated protein Cas7/Csh2 n=1 Tax=Campylobacter sputorum TaxID=206 RepID=UPI000B793925|nr:MULTISPECIES: type I-B CRISPR-associated protein Cas7/Csh2 [Campylobacter]ASM40104.1 CRISPR/Cas system-associated RAMP protein Cas7, type I-B/HMARI [Campylobacter sputorum]MBE7358745.1 type I-B CRISPR-associated protein Cas7/Csh2 [Campylobacter sp. RM11302]MBF6670071.1 type I-B CRISPR-associated protein Cas7/Csh2 [Campylobacter sp. RM12327]MBF6675199.1 type I-B CRISPR-associated protein Cas7/Csh2 [Campylobacter sp. RM13538]MBF6676811.1 type I-B CRISPR-associated protein Cas7/Csh2 [Campyloba